MVIPDNAHNREIVQVVDDHAKKGDLRGSLLQDIVNFLSFRPTYPELRFLRRYAAWRLEHSLSRISQL
jgi:hypothetical protein